MAGPLIDPGFVQDALAGLRQSGRDSLGVLASVGLCDPVSDPVTPEIYGQLWRAIAAETGDEFFGLGARPMRPGSFALMCQAMLHARDLGAALGRMLRFLGVVLDEPRGRLIRAPVDAAIELTGPPRPAFCDRTFGLLVLGPAGWLIGRHIPLRQVDFAGPAPTDKAGYDTFFGVPVRFDQPVTRFAFAAAHLGRSPVRDESALRRFLAGAPANLLTRMQADDGAAGRVRAILRDTPPAQWPDFDGLSKRLRLSPATLRRHLRAEGQGFAEIRDELRHARAETALSAGRKLAEIAAELGYSEPSAFHRAYRKWTGHAPGARTSKT